MLTDDEANKHALAALERMHAYTVPVQRRVPAYVIEMDRLHRLYATDDLEHTLARRNMLHDVMLVAEHRSGQVEWHLNPDTGNYEGFVNQPISPKDTP